MTVSPGSDLQVAPEAADFQQVTWFTRLRRPRAAAVAAACAAALAVPVSGGVAAASGAHPVQTGVLPGDSVGAASEKVRHILAQVHALSGRVRVAERRYAAALQDVASGVNAAISAERGQDAVRQLVDASRQRLQQQILLLYSSGGSFATTASLFSPQGLSEFQVTSHAVGTAVARTEQLERQQQSMAAMASQQVASTGRQATHSIATARTVAGVARRVQTLLARQQTLLAKARADLANQRALAAAQAALLAESSTFASTTDVGVNNIGVLPPSPAYLALYRKAAATCPGLPWTTLAAIGQVESGHGRNDGPSSAGAEGPMQFEPATFASYAVDGDHDGKVDIMDPADSIFTAARYLCANGGGRGATALSHAVWDYNHAAWYVQLVLNLAGKYADTYS